MVASVLARGLVNHQKRNYITLDLESWDAKIRRY